MSEPIRRLILIAWFFLAMYSASAIIVGPFETRLQCEFVAQEIKQLFHEGYVVRAGATTDCWEG